MPDTKIGVASLTRDFPPQKPEGLEYELDVRFNSNKRIYNNQNILIINWMFNRLNILINKVEN